MTEAYYKTRNYNTNHSAFGGLIYNYDFDNYISMSNIAERIVSDSKFDKQCKRNIENRKAENYTA